VEYHHESAAPSTYVYEFVWDRTAPAEGPFCTDVDGNVLMDFTSHVAAAAPLGYNNPKIMEPLAEFDLVDPLKIAGQDFYVAGGESPGDGLPGSSGLMERLTEITAHYDMDTVFLSNSGQRRSRTRSRSRTTTTPAAPNTRSRSTARSTGGRSARSRSTARNPCIAAISRRSAGFTTHPSATTGTAPPRPARAASSSTARRNSDASSTPSAVTSTPTT